MCRSRVQGIQLDYYTKTAGFFKNGKISDFWPRIHSRRNKRVPPRGVEATQMGKYYAGIMQDNNDLSNDHVTVSKKVHEYYSLHVNHHCFPSIIYLDVNRLIKKLRKNCSPGHDGVTTENLIYGNGPMLCNVLASVYNVILGFSCVPDVLKMGTAIPVLKKTTLKASMPENYRPITLSSTHAKMVELLLIPDSVISDTQLGFRATRGASFGCALLNDVIAYFHEKSSPVYICTLDAEKCFDSVWHDGLLYKLQSVLPVNH